MNTILSIHFIFKKTYLQIIILTEIYNIYMYHNLIDTHSHVLRSTYKKRRQDIIDLVISNNVKSINIGIDLDTSIEAVEISKKYPNNFFAVIGIHPTDSEKFDESVFPKLKKLYMENKDFIVAIGETGIDNKYQVSKEKQIFMFNKHIELARELGLPIVVHNREAFDEVLEVIVKNSDIQFLLHSWTGNIEQMKKYSIDNVWFSFSGIVTFNSAKDISKCLYIVNRKRFMIETDCPWLSPAPHRCKENDPVKTIHIAEFISQKLNMDLQKVLDMTYENANNLFNGMIKK